MAQADRRAGGLGIAICLSLSWPFQASAEGRPPIAASLEASSASASARHALDANARTAWCATPEDQRGEVVMRFSEPVTIKRLQVCAGRFMTLGTKTYQSPLLEVAAGEVRATLDPTENGQNPFEIEPLAKQRTTELRLRALPSKDQPARCLTEVLLELEEGPFLYDLEARDRASIPQAIEGLTKALVGCRPADLARWVHLPLSWVEIGAGYAGAQLYTNESTARTYRSVPSLKRLCFRPATVPPVPQLVGSIGPKTIRVHAYTVGGPVYWELTVKNHAWRLTRIADGTFE
jgi:hypothetical protein